MNSLHHSWERLVVAMGGGGRGRGRGKAVAKHKAVPKKVAKAKAVPAPPPSKPAPAPDAVAPAIVVVDEEGQISAQCPDKCVNARVNRLYTTKLKKFDRSELNKLAGRTTKLPVHVFLYKGIQNMTGSAKHLSTKLWAEFFSEYGLSSEKFFGIAALADPEQCEVDKGLMDALLEARVENPTERKSGPFTRWCEHADNASISKSSFILMLSGSLESDRVCARHSDEMITACQKFIGLHELNKKFPDVWQCIEGDMDMQLTNQWSKSSTSDDARTSWIIAHRHSLDPLMDVPLALEYLKKDLTLESF